MGLSRNSKCCHPEEHSDEGSQREKILRFAQNDKNAPFSNSSKLKKKAVVLLSGGLDSATTLYIAKAKGYKAYCLIFDYGQRHKKELLCAKTLAKRNDCDFHILKISLPWKGSSLLDKKSSIPKGVIKRSEIPSTYVPGRNIIFLSYGVSYAEAIGAKKVFIGANQLDYSGYPDCRYSFIEAFGRAVDEGTKSGLKKNTRIKIEVPLIYKSKRDIICMAVKLGVPLEYTWSCYRGGKKPCNECDSCLIRQEAFEKAGVNDPAAYC
ncbi:MAG: 7-cyano-7-deazaguanine synthase QueC [Candidatus Omnitrophota bacterium]